MRSIKVVFAALALSAATTAFAAAGPATQTVTLTNSMTDTIVTGGSATVTFSAVGAGVVTGSPTLAYSTDAQATAGTTGVTTRKVTVASSGTLPTNVTGTVSFTPASGNGTAAAVSLGSTTAVNLVTAIPRFITQTAAALTYSLSATTGFVSAPITVTYTLADEKSMATICARL